MLTWRPLLAASLFAAVSVLAPVGALAQAPVDELTYRDWLADCLKDGDYICAFEEMMRFGQEKELPVGVSPELGPTLFGAQLFEVIDRAGDTITVREKRIMAEAVIAHIVDYQPEGSFAIGPFLMLLGEACLVLEDDFCINNTMQGLQLLLDTNQWYPEPEDATGPSARDRATALLEQYRETLE